MSYIGNSPAVSVTPSSTTTFTGKTIDLTDNTVTGTKAEFDTACSDGNFVYVADIGSSVQAYDVDTAKLDVDQSWTGAQRGAITTKTDGTLIDLADGNNFNWTPAAADELSFTNETAGQSGFILLNNPSAYAITAGAELYFDSTFLTTISAAGTYLLSYFVVDSTHTYVVASGALT